MFGIFIFKRIALVRMVTSNLSMLKAASKKCGQWKTNLLQSCRFALWRDLPTESHQKAWRSFEKILVYRSNVFLVFSFLLSTA